jgi:hypothetical protein
MLYKNQLYEHKASGQRIRILELDSKSQTVWVFNITNPKALPKAYELGDLEAAITNQEFVAVTAQPNETVLHPSDTAKQRQNKAYACIEPLIKTPDIFDPHKRNALVNARAKELSCSPQTIYKYLRTWWRDGQSRNALTPRFHRIGSRSGVTGNRGRPPVFMDRTIYQLTETDHQHMQDVLKRYFLKSAVFTLSATYQRMLEERYSYIDSEGIRRIKAPGEYPSEAQFRWFVQKNLPKEASIRARKGDAHFELNHRAKLGSLRHETYTVGDVYEIDATVADVLLVHPDDRSKIIGKPILYMVRDRKSNLCVGFYVGIENASWPAAMHAIKSISEDKAALCKRYDLPYDPADWPANCVFPKTFIADRGSDMLSGGSSQLAESLEITVQNLPTRRGDWKPHVECGFKQTHRSIADCIPAYIPPEDFGKRQTKDYSRDAALTLEEFTRILLAAIIRSNRTPIKNYDLAPQYLLSSMQPTPINIWNAEIQDRAGLLTQYSEELVRFALLPRMQATVTREGIRIGNCYYSAPEAIAKEWFISAGRARFNVTVSYDRRLVDAIYVHDDRDPTKYFAGQLLDKCSHFRGRSFAEVESLNYLVTTLRHEGLQVKRQLQADFHSQVAPMIKEAKHEAKVASKGKSRSARKKDTVAARADVLRTQRQVDARLLPETPPEKEAAQVIPLPSAGKPPQALGESEQTHSATTKSRQQKYMELMNGL